MVKGKYLNRLGVVAAMLLSLALAPWALAEESSKKPTGSGPNPYSECGIGAAIFENVGWAAATSNVIWDLGVTAITSALSSPETCNAKKVATARLILETLPNLEQDLALGTGEHLAELQAVMQCGEQSANFTGSLRNAYAAEVSADDYSRKSQIEKASAFYGHAQVAAVGHCQAVL